MYAATSVPDGWLACDGRLITISTHPELFAILGTAHGGDGRVTFAIPDLRGRVPMGLGTGQSLSSRQLGDETGAETAVLSVSQMPSHRHDLIGTTNPANSDTPTGKILARPSQFIYRDDLPQVFLNSLAIGSKGSGSPHSIVQPSAVVNFIIAVNPLAARKRFLGTIWEPVVDTVIGPSNSIQLVTPDTFSNGAVDYFGLELLLHIPGEGNVWVAVPQINDLNVAAITPLIVLDPAGTDITSSKPAPRWPVKQALAGGAVVRSDIVLSNVEFSGLTEPMDVDAFPGESEDEFISNAMTYIPLEYLAYFGGMGQVWLAIEKSHDLTSAPAVLKIVLDESPPSYDINGTPVSGKFVDLSPFPRPRWPASQDFQANASLTTPLKFNAAAVDYLALEYLDPADGFGTVWVAMSLNHDLQSNPEDLRISLAPDVVEPTD